MPEVVVLGSTSLDTLETPFGRAVGVLGGSAAYAGYACSFFSRPGIVSIVGRDFPKKYLTLMGKRGMDLSGLARASGQTFRWHGRYGFDVNVVQTIRTELNVLKNFDPELPGEYRRAEYLFLGNTSPKTQLSVMQQMKKRPQLVVSDTMNYYIEKNRKQVLRVCKESDIALMNDSEARQLFRTPNLLAVARKILALDSSCAIIKKGEHGAIMVSRKGFFSAPGYPLENIVDPTGCGDCFGGALIGYLAKTKDFSEQGFRRAIVFASAVSSFNAEDFSLNKLTKISLKHIIARYKKFKEFVKF